MIDIREAMTVWPSLDEDERRTWSRTANAIAEKYLRPVLQEGTKFRAMAANCGAKFATYEFLRWEGFWIISRSGRSIAPCMVYSVSRRVIYCWPSAGETP